MRLFILIFSGLSLLSFAIQAQQLNPVKWKFEVKKVNDKEVEITAAAMMDTEWVIYSQFTEDDGPIATSFGVSDVEVKFVEKSKVIKEFDEMFGVNVLKFKEKAIFVGKLPMNDLGQWSGYVTFMTCNGMKCLPPKDVAFTVKL